MNHTGTLELATERLTLRRFEPEDAENAFYNWEGDAKVTEFLPEKPCADVAQAEERLKNEWLPAYEKNNGYLWAIELNETEQPIGILSAKSIDDDLSSVEISGRIGQAFWRKGYMTEAFDAAIGFFLGTVGAARVWGRCDAANEGAKKLMEKCGMDCEGTLRHAWRDNSGICDMAIYAKVKSEAMIEAEADDGDEVQAAVVTRVVAEDGTTRNVISDETMEYVGILAKLALSPEESAAAKKDMEEMLDYIDKLNELDTTGIEPMSHVFPVNNVFREDVVTNPDGHEATLSNAPLMKNDGFKVPKTIGE